MGHRLLSDSIRPVASPRGFDRDRVIEEAAALADTHGLRRLTLAMVASKLGMRSQSLYAHVNGIEGLQRDLALLSTRRLADTLQHSIMARSGASALRSLFEAFRVFASEHPGLLEAGMRPPGDDPDLIAANDRIATIFYAVLASFGVHDEDAVHHYRAMWTSLYGFVSARSAGLMSLPVDPDTSYEHLLHIFTTDLQNHMKSPGKVRVR